MNENGVQTMKTKDSLLDPKVSIIVPVYNREKFIQQLVMGIKEQSFRNFECILVDDGSTDRTGYLCDSLTFGDERFIVKHTSNFGVSHARNIALDIARGQYITFVDSDDSIPKDYLEKLVQRIETLKVDIVIGSFFLIYADGKAEKIDYPFEARVYALPEVMINFALNQKESGVFGRCWGKIFLRETISDIRFDESLKLAEDFDFYLSLYPKINSLFFDNTCEYGYYVGADNSSVQVADDDIDYIAQLRIYIHYKEFLEKEGYYCGQNEKIIEEQIQNYLFFSILHSKPHTIHETFHEVYSFFKISNIKPLRMKGLKGIVLNCIFNNNENRAFVIMKVYWILRQLLKGH